MKGRKEGKEDEVGFFFFSFEMKSFPCLVFSFFVSLPRLTNPEIGAHSFLLLSSSCV